MQDKTKQNKNLNVRFGLGKKDKEQWKNYI